MYSRMILNDIRQSKLITITTTGFVAVAAMLVSLAAILIVNLAGSIGTMMEQAKTPHFMQMHSGELDMEGLEDFAGMDVITNWQVLEFLNIENSEIKIGTNTLIDSGQDNGLSVQSDQFDYLLDLDGQVIVPKAGEVYVPITYWKSGFAEIGDTLTIYDYPLTVAGFLRDSQMNSTLSSSKRFLVNASDYEALRELGSVEYLIEYRLSDTQALGEFEAAYLAAGLPANGPAITYPMFQLINALTDGMLIGIILLVSLLVLVITFLCIRFTLLAKIEDDYREIGVMKAIGLRVQDIKRLYLAKYTAIGVVGCLLGFGLSFGYRGMLLQNIRLYMGDSGNTTLSLILGFAGTLLVFAAIAAYVGLVLRRFRKISAASAMRFGVSQEKKAGAKHFGLAGKTFPPVNLLLGVKDVLARKKLYSTLLVVLILATFIFVLPQNLYNTISSETFIRYMGIGQADLYLNIQQTADISAKTDEIIQTMEQDADITQYNLLTTKAYTVNMDDGSEIRLKVDLGDHSVFPVEYTAGSIPSAEDEIALSVLQAEDLEKTVGDTITISVSTGAKTLVICGIYSDITNGGKTAKAAFTDDGAETMWGTISVSLADTTKKDEIAAEYAQQFSFAKVSDITTSMEQVFGSIIQAVGKACLVAAVVALGITTLVVLLFIRMLQAKDRKDIAALKALGFTNQDIRSQYISRSLLVLIIAILLGMLLVGTLGSSIAGLVVSLAGVSSFRFEINPLVVYIICPLAIAAVTLAAAILGTAKAGRVEITENIKE